jgi:hypothetical protein
VFVVMFYHFGFIGWLRIRRRKPRVDEWLYKCGIHHAGKKKTFSKRVFYIHVKFLLMTLTTFVSKIQKSCVCIHPPQLKLSKLSPKLFFFRKKT